MEEKQRTIQQNKALHKWCEMIADAYNQKGLTVNEVINNFTMELFWTKESVKELIIKTATRRMYSKGSTTELASVGEIDKIVDVVTKFNAKMEVEYIPFPSLEKEELDQ